MSSSAFDDLSGIAFTDGDDAFAAIAGRVAPTACTRTTGSKVKIAKEARAVRRAEEAARAARDARDAAKAATNRDPAADDPAPPAGNHAPAPRHTDDNPAPTGGRGGNETGDDAPAPTSGARPPEVPGAPPGGMSVYRAPSAGNGPSELENGLNPLNHLEGDQSAYVGSESVARDFADPRIGGYENGYINFQMHPDFETEFAPYRFRYDLRGPDRWEYQIPQDMIGRFNDLTINRSWIPM